MNALYAALGALLLAAGTFATGYHFGGLSGRLAAAQTVVKQEVATQRRTTTDQATVAEEAKTYEAAIDPLAPLPAPVVRLCYNSTARAAVPSAHPAGSGAAPGPPIPAAAAAPTLPGPDIGRPVLQVGRRADAQVAGLIDYIQRVCRVPVP